MKVLLTRSIAVLLAPTAAMSCSTGEPVTLATGQSPAGIAVSAGTLYWVNDDGTVKQVPTSGGTVATTLASGQGAPSSIAADGKNVYWTDQGTASCTNVTPCPPSGTVMMMPIAGGTPATLASGQDGPQSIAIDASNVYWINQSSAPGAQTGSLMQVPIAGGTPITLAQGVWSTGGVAVDATSVYYADFGFGTGPCAPACSEVLKVPIGGGTPAVLASQQSLPAGLAVDATSVYWLAARLSEYGVASGDALLMKVATAGGTPVVLASSDSAPGALAVDGTYVYWSDGTDFQKIPVGGGTPTAFALGVGNGVTAFAQDATNIYWAELGYGAYGNYGTYNDYGDLLSTPKSP